MGRILFLITLVALLVGASTRTGFERTASADARTRQGRSRLARTLHLARFSGGLVRGRRVVPRWGTQDGLRPSRTRTSDRPTRSQSQPNPRPVKRSTSSPHPEPSTGRPSSS